LETVVNVHEQKRNILESLYFDQDGQLIPEQFQGELNTRNATLINAVPGDIAFACLYAFPQDSAEYVRNLIHYRKHGKFPDGPDSKPLYASYEEFLKSCQEEIDRAESFTFACVTTLDEFKEKAAHWGLDVERVQEIFVLGAAERAVIVNHADKRNESRDLLLMHEMNHLEEEKIYLHPRDTSRPWKEHFLFQAVYEALTDLRALALVPAGRWSQKQMSYWSKLDETDLIYIKRMMADSQATTLPELLLVLKKAAADNPRFQEAIKIQFANRGSLEEVLGEFNRVTDGLLALPKYTRDNTLERLS